MRVHPWHTGWRSWPQAHEPRRPLIGPDALSCLTPLRRFVLGEVQRQSWWERLRRWLRQGGR